MAQLLSVACRLRLDFLRTLARLVVSCCALSHIHIFLIEIKWDRASNVAMRRVPKCFLLLAGVMGLWSQLSLGP